jgi:hypothetical protein
MNNNKILKLEIISFLFTLIFSTVFHFLYEWTGECKLIAPFLPVNESVWEHGKLLFMPYLLFAVIEYFLIPDKHNYIFAKCLSLAISVPFMIVLFYTYSGILGFNVLLIDIAITFIIVFIMNYLSYNILISDKTYKNNTVIVIAILFFIMFILFTFFPPHINLFLDTTDNTYGIK